MHNAVGGCLRNQKRGEMELYKQTARLDVYIIRVYAEVSSPIT